MVQTLTIALTLYFIATIGIYLKEHKINVAFKTIPESFWFTVIFIFSGMDVSPPLTLTGRAMAIFIFFLNIFIFGLAVGKLTDTLLEKREFKLDKNSKGHLIICNWNENGKNVIIEINNKKNTKNFNIIILSSKRLKM